jgi:hypothetical protein
MFVSRVNAPSKQSCLQKAPCPSNLFCEHTFITPPETKLVVIDVLFATNYPTKDDYGLFINKL